MNAEIKKIRINSPASMLAAVPVLLGFVPEEKSLVIVGIEPDSLEVLVTIRCDLPENLYAASALIAHAAAILSTSDVPRVVAVGYGPDGLIKPFAEAIRTVLPEAGIAVGEVLRVEDGHYWSYVCTDIQCCRPDGNPFDTNARVAETTTKGEPILESRSALVATLAPVVGDDAESMRQALSSARQRSLKLTRPHAERSARRRALWAPGVQAVDEAISRYRNDGGALSHSEAAWLALLLEDLRVRDHAWSLCDPEHATAHLRLWTDLTRLTNGAHVAAPASLLAFVAWQSGNGALANVALDRAQAGDPDYSMAGLLRQLLNSGAPPSMARRLPMTSGEVGESYDELLGSGDEETGEA